MHPKNAKISGYYAVLHREESPSTVDNNPETTSQPAMRLNLKSLFLPLFLLLLFHATGYSQVSPTEDVVYLKNGSILRGKVIEFNPTGDIKVEIMGGSILVYPAADVLKIVAEPRQTPVQVYSHSPYVPRVKEPFVYKSKGIANTTLFGFVAGSDNGGVSLENITSWVFNPRLQPGISVGFDRTGWQLRFFPLQADLRGDLLPKSPITPYYFAQVGYGFPIAPTQAWDWGITNLKGGITAGGGLGIKFNTRYLLRWHVALGYEMQKASYDQTNWGGWPQHVNASLYRVSFKLGFSL